MSLYLYLITLILAFCSIVYELLLGQILSAFLGNTILRYSITIGLYMFSMGFGALLLPQRLYERAITSLLKVEIALSIIGASSVIILLAAHTVGIEGMLFHGLAYGLIVAIGVLTGFEIPLLMAIGNRIKPDSEARVLGIDYVGAFLGAVTFALFFYPEMGIFATAITIGLLNSAVGTSVFIFNGFVESEERSVFRWLFFIQISVLFFLIFLLFNIQSVELIGIDMYLSH